VTVHREHKVKRGNQQDATNSMFIIKLSVSTCFGHHYAHHQGNKTVYYWMRCSAWVCRLWLAVVVCSCVLSCVACVEVTVRRRTHSSRRSSTRPQPTTAYTPRQNTACSRTRSYSPDDGHNDARNMLGQKV